MLTGDNFGSGSSREHAAQATKVRYKAVIGASFAPIYGDNCYSIGVPLLRVSPEHMAILFQQAESKPDTQFTLDLEQRLISYNGSTLPFMMDDGVVNDFLNGTWDIREKLAKNLPKIREVLEKHPYALVK